jgi:hypothetical protein
VEAHVLSSLSWPGMLLSCRFCSVCLTPGTPETKQQTPYGSLMTSAETPTQHRISWNRAGSYRVSRRDPLVGSRVPLARIMALRCVGVFGQLERGALVSVHPDEARSGLLPRRYWHSQRSQMLVNSVAHKHQDHGREGGVIGVDRVVLLADAAEVLVVLGLHELLPYLAALVDQSLEQEQQHIRVSCF